MGSSHEELEEKKGSLQISASEANESSNVSSIPQLVEEQENIKKIRNKIKRKKWKLKRKLRSKVLQKDSTDKDGNEEVPKVAASKNRKKREREDFVDEELLERRRIKREKRLKRNEMREKAKEEGEKKSTEMIEKAKKQNEEEKSNEMGDNSKGEEDKKNNEVGNEAVDFEKKADEESKVNQSENKKVYVGGIPYYSSEDDIRSFFESCGTITEMDCMTFPETGKFRGIVFLTFKTEAAAKRALSLDGADMGGFFLKIQPYKAKQQTTKPEFIPEAIEGYNRAYVGNLSWDITEDDLKSFFLDCKISTIRFGMDKETGEFKGYAHVDFEDPMSLSMALKLDQHVVCGRPARISRAVPPKKVVGPVGQPNKVNEPDDGLEKVNKPEPKKEEDGVITGSKKKRRTCYECGVPGHLSSACPTKKVAAAAES